MTGVTALARRAEECLAGKVGIPGSPLWHMGKIAKFGSSDSLRLLQDAVDFLTCKAKAGLPFTEDEKEFLREILEAFWWGGHYKGFHEAARLANHYVNGDGKGIEINSDVYTSSVIVQDTMAAMKLYIRDLITANKFSALIKSDDSGFRRSAYFKTISQNATPPRQAGRQGWVWPTGVLLAEQGNLRLKKADHQFYLEAKTTPVARGQISTTWSVRSLYDFEPFEKKDYVTAIPLAKGQDLKIPDGLLHYMTKIGAAKEFWHSAAWRETWELPKERK